MQGEQIQQQNEHVQKMVVVSKR